MMNMILKNIAGVDFASAGKFVEGDGTLHPRRRLDSAVLLVGCGGCYPIAQDGREYMLTKDSYLLLFPGHEHYGTAPARGGQSHFWCHFTFPEGAAEYTEETGSGTFRIPEYGTILHPERIRLLFHQMIDSSERIYEDVGSKRLMCGLYIRLILAELNENALEAGRALVPDTLAEANGKSRAVAAKVKEYLRIHAREDISAAHLASVFHYNPDYLTHIFREEYGTTICAYTNSVRIEEAKKLLLDSDLKIGDVAAAVGFRDVKYFMKAFKRSAGVTPSEFRQSHFRVHMNIR